MMHNKTIPANSARCFRWFQIPERYFKIFPFFASVRNKKPHRSAANGKCRKVYYKAAYKKCLPGNSNKHISRCHLLLLPDLFFSDFSIPRSSVDIRERNTSRESGCGWSVGEIHIRPSPPVAPDCPFAVRVFCSSGVSWCLLLIYCFEKHLSSFCVFYCVPPFMSFSYPEIHLNAVELSRIAIFNDWNQKLLFFKLTNCIKSIQWNNFLHFSIDYGYKFCNVLVLRY